MGLTAGLILGTAAIGGSTASQIVKSNETANAASAQMAQNQADQTKLYTQISQQETDQEGAGAAVNARNQATQFEDNNIKQASGVQSTVLTSPLGIPDSENSNLQKKTLLGM